MKKYINTKKIIYFFPSIKNKFDIFIFAIFSIFIYKNNIILSAFTMSPDYLPGANIRKEYLIGHIISENPFYLGGAYSGSLTGNHPGPIPYNYPSALGWFIYDLLPNQNIYPYYITYNILYLIALSLLFISYLLVKKIFNNQTSSLYLIIIMASFIFNNGSDYTSGLPSHFNPGSMQILSIVTIFSLIAQIKHSNLNYTYLTIFISGLLMQNHLATLLFSIIALGISFYYLYINKKYIKKTLLILALIPWIQVMLRIIIEFDSIVSIIKYLNYRSDGIANSRTTLVDQLPFNSVLQKFNISTPAESFSLLFIILFILLPIVNYLILNYNLILTTKQKKILLTLTILFIVDIIVNIIISKEPHQHNHLASYSYLFIISFFYLLSKIRLTKTKYSFFIILSIFILYFNNSQNLVINGNNNLLSTNAIVKLKASPVKIEQFDYYNMISSGYLDLVYELLINRVDFCIKKPNLYNLNKLFYPNQVKNLTANLGFIKHLYCDEKQINEKNRKSIYLLENATGTLPAKIANLSQVTRLPNLDNRECLPEYFIFENIKLDYKNHCGVYNSYPPLIDQSLYIQDLPISISEQIDNNIYTEKKYGSIDNYDLDCKRNCKSIYLDINQQINSITDIYSFFSSKNVSINTYDTEIKNIISMYQSKYTKLKLIENININSELLGYLKISYHERNDIEEIKLFSNNDDKYKKNEFACTIKINNKDDKVIFSYPECNYNNNNEINKTLNEKIHKKTSMAELYKKIYHEYNGKPLSVNNISINLENKDITSNSNIKNLYIISSNNKISNKNLLFNNGKKESNDTVDEFLDKYPLVDKKIKISYHDKSIFESCIANIYQPWYYIIPQYYHINIIECKN
jgi:hypothetical protein